MAELPCASTRPRLLRLYKAVLTEFLKLTRSAATTIESPKFQIVSLTTSLVVIDAGAACRNACETNCVSAPRSPYLPAHARTTPPAAGSTCE